MLQDPRHEHGTLDHFILWLESHDPATEYSFASCRDCLASRYIAAIGLTALWYDEWPPLLQAIHKGADPHKIAKGCSPLKPWDTYGAALQRAYAARQGR